jgi:hypothetical protein
MELWSTEAVADIAILASLYNNNKEVLLARIAYVLHIKKITRSDIIFC